MNLIALLVILVVFGAILYLINNLIPLDPKVRMVINVVAAIFLLLYVLQAFGLLGAIGNVRLR